MKSERGGAKHDEFCTKTSKRTGQPEHVLIHDPHILTLAMAVAPTLDLDSCIYPGKWPALAKDITRLASFFGFVNARLTPHCLRRGGATWHFGTYQSYDATQERGRWQDARSAKQYIAQAMSEASLLDLPAWGTRRLSRARRCFNHELDAMVRSMAQQ